MYLHCSLPYPLKIRQYFELLYEIKRAHYIYPLSTLFSLNFGLATGVVVFFNILNELVMPPSTAVKGFSIRPL